MGWSDDKVIQACIERLHALKINRLRVTIAGRTNTFYGEPVMVDPKWTTYITPWPAGKDFRFLNDVGRLGQRLQIGDGSSDSLANLGLAGDIYHPGFDHDRFQVSCWQNSSGHFALRGIGT